LRSTPRRCGPRVTATAADNSISRIVCMVEQATASRAPTQQLHRTILGILGHRRDGGFGAGHSIPRPALAYNMRRLVWMTESAAPA
jgi:hypothetical protein